MSNKKGALILVIMGLLVCMFLLFFCKTKNDDGKIKVGLVLSPSAPYQLRQAIMKNVNSRENMAVLCINTGYRVFDDETVISGASEKIDQLIDVGVDAVGLVYLDYDEQEECLKKLSDKKIPAFVLSQDLNFDSGKTSYFSFVDSVRAMQVSTRYIYNLAEHKDKVAVITDTRRIHGKMANAFSNHYCRMAKLDKIEIFALDIEQKAVLSSMQLDDTSDINLFQIPGFREILNACRIKRAAACPDGSGPNCSCCGGLIFKYPCGHCGYDGGGPLCPSLPNTGKIKRADSVNDVITQVENSKAEVIYVIGDVAPAFAFRHINGNARMVATGSELLTLKAIECGKVVANVDPDWCRTGGGFFDSIGSYFKGEPYPKWEAVSYMVKDYRYYSENSPTELPLGKGLRNNIK